MRSMLFFFLRNRVPRSLHRTYTPFPYTTLFRSAGIRAHGHAPDLIAARRVGDEIEQPIRAEGGRAFILARCVGDMRGLSALCRAVDDPQAGRALEIGRAHV